MHYDFLLPDLGEGVAEGEITEWLIAVGQEVTEDQPMVEVETDKATVDIQCPVDGVVLALHAEPGERVSVGRLLITIDTAGDGAAERGQAENGAKPGAPAPEPAVSSVSVKATPGVRALARELGLDLTKLTGSGPSGAITERDVRSAAGGGGAVVTGRREPLRGVRRRIADRLTRSHQEIPKVTVVEECDFTELAERRGSMSYTPFVLQAVVSGLKEFPEFNSTIDGEDIVYLDRYDIGVAAQGPKGLVVPVVRGIDSKSVEQLNAEVAALGEAVREDTIAPEDLRGGTFTVTLAGKLGGFFATPLVNLGEAAILGVHRISPRPVVRDGEIVIREIGLLSCSFDHRITDGTRATMFLLHVIDQLQQ
jgi:pyruvate dehydrogenase E2 component (dihydrolipoamide acetyltransferase)